jgi:hypothetical protein
MRKIRLYDDPQSSLSCTRSVFSESSLGPSSSIVNVLKSSKLSKLKPHISLIGVTLDCRVVLDSGIPVFLVIIVRRGLRYLYSRTSISKSVN